jgi:hypothetical protein
MYAYSPDKEKWTPIRDMENVDLAALCYSAKEDVLYGIAFDYGSGPTLYQYHPEGAIQKKTRLGETGRLGRRHVGDVQMVAAGKYLIVLVPSSGPPLVGDASAVEVYVVDPRSGDVLFAHPQLPPLSAEEQERTFLELLASAAPSRTQGHLAPAPTPRQNGASPNSRRAALQKIAPVRNPANGHFYERVQGFGVPWEQAKRFAESRVHAGMRGYLATITSQQENDFLVLQWGQGGAAWIGASDTEEEGKWKWVTGPEAGTVFWIGAGNGRAQGYQNWSQGGPFSNEPNNMGGKEHYALWNASGPPMKDGAGTWNDVAADHACEGILIEYSPDLRASNH